MNKENQCTARLRPEKDPSNKRTKMQKPFPWSECGSTLFKLKVQNKEEKQDKKGKRRV